MVTDRVVRVVNRSGRFVQTGTLPPPYFYRSDRVGSRQTEPIHMGELSPCGHVPCQHCSWITGQTGSKRMLTDLSG